MTTDEVDRDTAEDGPRRPGTVGTHELLETAFAQAPIGMALIGLDGSWLKVNGAMCRMTGFSEAELLGHTFPDSAHPDDLGPELVNLERLRTGEIDRFQTEKRYVTHGGDLRWVLLSVSLARGAAGEPRYFISQMEDISRRKRDEQRLRDAERQARIERDHATAIIGAMREGYALTVGDELRAVNEALCKLTGFSESELVGARTPYPFWPPERRRQNEAMWRRMIELRGGTFELLLMRRDGERFEAEITVARAFDAAGESLGVVNTIRDVSVQLRQQRELERLARTDSLTGLSNRRVLQESLERAAALARRHDRPLALVLLDVDRFKQVNDHHGHPVGDSVLVEVAQRLAGTIRSGEVLARVGGEEFACLIPDARAEEAITAADRARRVIAAMPFHSAGHLTVSAGVGLMHAPEDGDSLYRLADRALYDAKREGRNLTRCLAAGYKPSEDELSGESPLLALD